AGERRTVRRAARGSGPDRELRVDERRAARAQGRAARLRRGPVEPDVARDAVHPEEEAQRLVLSLRSGGAGREGDGELIARRHAAVRRGAVVGPGEEAAGGDARGGDGRLREQRVRRGEGSALDRAGRGGSEAREGEQESGEHGGARGVGRGRRSPPPSIYPAQ